MGLGGGVGGVEGGIGHCWVRHAWVGAGGVEGVVGVGGGQVRGGGGEVWGGRGVEAGQGSQGRREARGEAIEEQREWF